jgi:hypothetical protein
MPMPMQYEMLMRIVFMLNWMHLFRNSSSKQYFCQKSQYTIRRSQYLHLPYPALFLGLFRQADHQA